MGSLSVNLCGIELDNPVIPASGTFGYGYEFAELYDINCLGTFSFKGTTKEPRFGNPTPRIAECEAGMINAVGLQNPGIDAVIARPDLWLNMNTINVYALMGGSGCTLALLIATFIWGKWRPSREVAKLGILPAIFNINEPVIYGYPIVFNIPLMVPFVLNTIIGILVGYFATVIGLVNPTCIQVPWTTPIIASGFLSTGGDWRAAVLQVVLLALFVIIYLPFMKASEVAQRKQFEMAE